MVLGKDAEDNSAPKSAMEKPPGTPDMSAHETKDMVYSILRDSPLPDTERSDDNSQRMVEVASFQRRRMMGRSFSRETTISCLKRPPTGKLVPPCTEKVLFLCS